MIMALIPILDIFLLIQSIRLVIHTTANTTLTMITITAIPVS